MSAVARRPRGLGLLVAAAVFAADQLVKFILTVPLELQSRQLIRLIPFFDLRWAENQGVSMGLLTASSDGQRWLLVGLTGALAIGVLVWMWRERVKGDVIALGMILGGALGNILDRVRYGYVVDYADLHIKDFRPFFIFNLADAAITIGVLILVARALLTRDKPATQEESSHV